MTDFPRPMSIRPATSVARTLQRLALVMGLVALVLIGSAVAAAHRAFAQHGTGEAALFCRGLFSTSPQPYVQAAVGTSMRYSVNNAVVYVDADGIDHLVTLSPASDCYINPLF